MVRYNHNNKMISKDILEYAEFEENSLLIMNIKNHVEIFKIDIGDIVPEQLTVSKAKVDSVNTWIEKPEDIVVTCVEIENQIVCIDGYSRLVAAYIRGFNYVYAYLETDNDNMEFYKTCMKWCQEEKIFSIKDLTNRIVSPEEHERLWINRCQTYLKNMR